MMNFKLRLKPLFIMGLLLVAGISEATTDQYRIMWRDAPSTTMVIGWNQVSGSNPMVHYGTTDEGTDVTAYPNSKTPDRVAVVGSMRNTFARLTGLEPNTAYYFVIKDSQGTSERFWFKTAPDVNTERLSFIAGGDSRNNRVPRINANKLVAKLRPHAVLFGGDLTDNNTNFQLNGWLDDWQHTIGEDGRMIPVVMTRGNHESSNNTIVDLFDVPSNDVYYALTFGGDLIRTYTLNTEITIGGNQTNWLANDLAANGDIIWRTAQYHKGMRPHVASKSEGTNQYNNWAPLFEQHRVQLVIECDAHTVKTTWPIVPSFGTNSDEGFARDDCNGTVYAGEGCWGAPLRDNNDDKSWTRASGEFNQFKWIFVDKEKIELRTVVIDSTVVVPDIGQVDDNDIFTPPANLAIWEPDNNTGSVVTIQGAGSLCDDGDVCTTDDVLDTNCNCAGTVQTDCSPCQQSDSLALVAVYNALDGDNWRSSYRWDLTQPMDTWRYVTLNENGCVDKLNMRDRRTLRGTLPTEIGDLSEITELTFRDMYRINGPIPASIGNLTSLVKLDLSKNSLTGEIPATIGDLNNLEIMDLSYNNLTGEIPATIGDLNNLETLNLGNNGLTGEIPVVIGNLNSLKALNLPKNGLTGEIPVAIGNLNSLETLALWSNSLVGEVPVSIENLTNLTSLSLSHNQLTNIPSSVGNLTNLISLSMGYNQLTNIPSSVGNLSNLQYLELQQNSLVSVPASLGNLAQLKTLRLDDNQITGSLPVWLADLEDLYVFFINNNQLEGCYSNELSTLCSRIASYSKISEGNNFNAEWDDFCSTGAGGCGSKTDESTTINTSSYPNPFTEHTTITYTLPTDGAVTLTIHNAAGKEIAVLEENETKTAGTHSAIFESNLYPAGVYHYTIQAGEYIGTQKMILVK